MATTQEKLDIVVSARGAGQAESEFKKIRESLKATFGRGGEITQNVKMLMGGGAIMGLSLIANSVVNFTEKLRDMSIAIRNGNAAWGEFAEKTVESIPIFGQAWQAGRNIREMITGEMAADQRELERFTAGRMAGKLGSESEARLAAQGIRFAQLQGRPAEAERLRFEAEREAARRSIAEKYTAEEEALRKSGGANVVAMEGLRLRRKAEISSSDYLLGLEHEKREKERIAEVDAKRLAMSEQLRAAEQTIMEQAAAQGDTAAEQWLKDSAAARKYSEQLRALGAIVESDVATKGQKQLATQRIARIRELMRAENNASPEQAPQFAGAYQSRFETGIGSGIGSSAAGASAVASAKKMSRDMAATAEATAKTNELLGQLVQKSTLFFLGRLRT